MTANANTETANSRWTCFDAAPAPAEVVGRSQESGASDRAANQRKEAADDEGLETGPFPFPGAVGTKSDSGVSDSSPKGADASHLEIARGPAAARREAVEPVPVAVRSSPRPIWHTDLPPLPKPPRPVRAAMPQRQDDLLEWCLLYTATLLDNPAVYDTPVEEAAEIRRLVLAWDEAREKRRTGEGKLLAKNLAMSHAVFAVRCHAGRVRRHNRISTDDKLALGFEIAGTPRRR